MAKAKKQEATERDYNTIVSPHITEKATLGSEHGQITFKVKKDATKLEIKQAVENLFGVSVKAVNTIVQKGKTKRFKGFAGKRSDFKKAIVTLEEGQTIDTGTGV
ncbi:MAG: 50S ribosomal protein L23 [Micavibrio sp. TMED27]|nr:50S ribosomal protein L23 [Micavibrio sp.]OUT90571.1 MAG: 50S ribosomal protein L23 [Micavibrio sp. TMED27]|tara:strand:+ start:189 stop:503 length:315 start_codon:yes stop_codon:yes gene_type:complete